jgi:hypothetical protein
MYGGGGPVLFQKCAFMVLQLVEYYMDRFTRADMGLMAVLSRSIWLRRNKFIFENIFTHPQQVYKDSVDSLDDFQKCNVQDEVGITSHGELPQAIHGW